MKKAKKIYNLTMSKVTVHDALGAMVELTPVDTFSRPQKVEEGVYYIVEDIYEYPHRNDVVRATYAGTNMLGTTLYTLRDLHGAEVILDNVNFGSKPIFNRIPKKDVKI
ncbi:hypothetical protein IKF84_03070 [Candidatus Saccharibacteria bacterium]|nr:hypothetical protein [Candidatus Saccharibacteria bacterium]